MTLTRASVRLAARLRRRNELTHARADATANAADRAVGSVWQDFLHLLRIKGGWLYKELIARQIFLALFNRINGRIISSLEKHVDSAWRGTVRDIGEAVPRHQLARAAGVAIVQEDQGDSEPGLLSVEDYLDLLFPPPPAADVHAIIFGNRWQERLEACTRLADPGTLASIVSAGIIAGKSNQQIAQEVLPAVNNVRSSARRIARTESVRVAGAMAMKAHEALGDLVIGFTLHSMHDHHVRAWHLARDGRQYFKNPKPGQDGLDKMPHPPDEPVDPSERPPGTPSTAWNCRCFLTPILRP